MIRRYAKAHIMMKYILTYLSLTDISALIFVIMDNELVSQGKDNPIEKLVDATLFMTDKSVSPLKRVEYAQARKFSYEEDLKVKFKHNLVDAFVSKQNTKFSI